MALKDIHIKNLKAKEKSYRVADQDGLVIEVRPTGSKFWRYRYRYAGKANMLTVGEYPIVSLADARDQVKVFQTQLANNIDPSQKRKNDKARQLNAHNEQVVAAFTLKDAFLEWYHFKLPEWTSKHAQGVESRFNAYLTPLASKALTEITPADCIATLKEIEATGKLTTLAKVKIILGQVMRYMVSIGKLGSDPSRDISRDIFTKQTKRNYAHQTDPRIIREVYATICLPYRGYATVKNAIILLALTFLRANELAGLKWSEVDMEHRRLRIEAERMKMKREHIVPLSHQAISIIEQQRQFMIGSQFVFPSWLNQHGHITTQSLLQGMRRQGVSKEAFTSHGWRHSASTTLHELGFTPQAIEAQLAHIVGGVSGVYNKALHLEERTAMMQAWADWLSSSTNDK